ncbi:MAG: radical SAM protein [Acidobacteriota bacterium]
MRTTWDDNVLFSVLLELTYACNLDCDFCYNDLALRGQPLSYEQYEALLDELAELGALNLILTGGEPLAHPRFLDIGELARDRGFVVRIKSNGHALRGVRARRIQERIDPFLIEVSLHGACAATHDRQTRVPGSFDRLLANLEELRELGLRIKINSTLTRWNEDEIEGMYEIADGLGYRLQIDPEVTPRDDGDVSPLELSATREGLQRLFEIQRQRSAAASQAEPPSEAPVKTSSAPARPQKHCGAGSSGLAIDPFGNVYPCVQWRRPVGSLHESSLAQLWRGSPVLDEVREATVKVRQHLLGLGERAPTAFCPGAAEASTGSPFELHAPAERRRDSERAVRSLPVLA